MIRRHTLLACLPLALLTASPVNAACLNPAGTEGENIYNADYHTMQFCNGTNWVSMAASGMATEVDPHVGTLTNGKWCSTDGTIINCTADAPVSGVGGSSGQVQYNSGSGLAGASALTYATSGDLLTATALAATDTPLVIKGAASQSANLTEWRNSSGAPLVTVTADGKVGIGTTSPGFLLSLQGTNAQINLTENGVIGTNSPGLYLYHSALPAAADQRIGFIVSGSGMSGTARNPAAIEFKSSAAWTDGNSYPTYIDFGTTASGSTSRTVRMRIDSTGNVGIGSTNPQAKFDVYDTLSYFRVAPASNSSAYGVTVSNTDTAVTFNTNSSSRGYVFSRNGTSDLVVSPAGYGGNVGIGTTSPGQKLTVAGTVESTSGGFKFPDGTTQATAAAATALSGSGTTNYIAKFTGASTIGNSAVSESGGVLTAPKIVVTDLKIGAGGTCGQSDTGKLRLSGTNIQYCVGGDWRNLSGTTTGTGDGYYVWTGRNSSAGNLSYIAVASSADGTKLAAAVNSGYIYTSTDSGVTWTQRTGAGSRNWFSLASNYDGTKLAAGEYGGYIYTSSDGGATWTERTSASGLWYGITSSSDGNKLAAVSRNGYVYTSTDGGANWIAQTGSGSRNWLSIAGSSDGTKLVAAAYSGYIYSSNDSGLTWTARSGPGSQSWVSLAISNDGTRLAAVATGDYLYTSADSGATWTQRTSLGSKAWKGVASSRDGLRIVAVATSSSPMSSSDGGESFLTTNLSSGYLYNVVACSDNCEQAVLGNNTGYIYTGVRQ